MASRITRARSTKGLATSIATWDVEPWNAFGPILLKRWNPEAVVSAENSIANKKTRGIALLSLERVTGLTRTQVVMRESRAQEKREQFDTLISRGWIPHRRIASRRCVW